jgi:hydrogenase maturation protease
MSVDFGGWEALERPAPDAVVVGGVQVRRGSRVRLAPRAGGDVFDLALAGRTAIVDAIESDVDGGLLIAVTVDDDPGRDLGEERQPGHRFFFTAGEVEPLPDEARPAGDIGPRILVAGIGNVFLGDDGFGVAAADRLARARLPAGVDVVDYGIRGMDLAYALAAYDVAILLDAAPRGGAPGSVYVVEPDLEDLHAVPDAHGMDPVKVLALARQLGPLPQRVLVVACEPRTVPTGEEDDLVVELSEPVRAAVEPAVRLVQRLLGELRESTPRRTEEP